MFTGAHVQSTARGAENDPALILRRALNTLDVSSHPVLGRAVVVARPTYSHIPAVRVDGFHRCALCGRVWRMSVLRAARFRRYLLGQAASLFGDSLVPLTIAFAALDVAGPGGVGVVLAANRIPVAVLVLAGGVLGDRWPRRRLMVGADVLRCAVQAVSGLLLVTGHAGLMALVVLQALAGVGTAVFVPAASGLVPSLVGEDQVLAANALLGLVGNVNKVVSISVAGVLVASVV